MRRLKSLFRPVTTRAAGTAALVTLLAACTPPDTAPQLSQRAPADLGLTGAPMPSIDPSWWTAFGDPQLDRIVADALAGSPDLDAALARVRQAQAVLARRDAETGPDITGDANAQVSRLSGRYTIPPPYGGSVRFLGTAQANLSWNLDLFGRQRAAIEGARASLAAASYDVDAARLMLAGSIVSTYAEVARAERVAGIARQTIATRERAVRLVNTRVQNRLASELDVQAAHHHVFERGHDVGEVRVDLRVDVLEVHIHHRRPGFLQIGKGLLERL